MTVINQTREHRRWKRKQRDENSLISPWSQRKSIPLSELKYKSHNAQCWWLCLKPFYNYELRLSTDWRLDWTLEWTSIMTNYFYFLCNLSLSPPKKRLGSNINYLSHNSDKIFWTKRCTYKNTWLTLRQFIVHFFSYSSFWHLFLQILLCSINILTLETYLQPTTSYSKTNISIHFNLILYRFSVSTLRKDRIIYNLVHSWIYI